MKRGILFLKGVCMGVADIIPGVSGGTLALILGIYAELVNTIKGLHLRWVPIAWQWIRSGFGHQEGRRLRKDLEEMNLGFLMVLGVGIASAIIAGGLILPTLLERYPEVMRALFFGLIVASVPVPFRMITFRGPKTRGVVAATILIGIVLGWMATAPHRMMEMGTTWVTVEAGPEETLKEISRRAPSAWPGEKVFWADENQELRNQLSEEIARLELGPPGMEASQEKDAVRARSEIYEELAIPAGLPVQIPQPSWWFVFLVGMIAICAMILPGISGSYLLLILGAYYFILNALKGVIIGVVGLSPPPAATFYVAIFGAGAAIGLLSFARLMSLLLRKYPAGTLGILVGLMVGCLRGIWPFQAMVEGQLKNVLPTAIDGTVLGVAMAAVAGALAVMLLSRLGSRYEENRLETAEYPRD